MLRVIALPTEFGGFRAQASFCLALPSRQWHRTDPLSPLNGLGLPRLPSRSLPQYVATLGEYIPPMVADFSSLTDTGCVYVATGNGNKLLGYIVFYQRDDHIFLKNVAVHTHATGRGVGKRLISLCEAQAKHRNARSVQLYTNKTMNDNLSIYPHLGYRETERKTEDGFHRVCAISKFRKRGLLRICRIDTQLAKLRSKLHSYAPMTQVLIRNP